MQLENPPNLNAAKFSAKENREIKMQQKYRFIVK